MLSILTNDGFLPLQHKVNNFYVDLQYGGFHSLSFDISIKADLYPILVEESVLQYAGNSWIIKKINERSGSALSTITAELDLRDWKGQQFDHFITETQSLSYVLEYIKPAGWSIINAGLVARRLSIDLERMTAYDLLQKCAEYYNVLYEFDTISKTVNVIKPIDVGQDRGLYLSRELNLTALDLKGTSENLITRLIPLGKRDEETETYLDITSVNDNRNYIDNRDYLDKTIVGWWIDERYTDPQSLKDAAIEKLKVLSVPTRAYTCTVMDLAKVKPKKYGFLNFELYDSLVLLDELHKVRLIHQIVKYRNYPDEPNRNVITLSTVPQQIKSQIKVITGKIDESLTYTRNIKNEILRSIDTNYAKISETYTKGQTEVLIQSEITQSQELIRTEVSQTYLTKNDGQTAINGLQSVIEQQAGKIEMAVKSVQVPNLLSNTSLQFDGAPWTFTPGAMIERNPEIYSGGNVISIRSDGSSPVYCMQYLYPGRKMHHKLTLSAGVRGAGTDIDQNATVAIGVQITYEDGTRLGNSLGITRVLTNEFKRNRHVFEVNPDKAIKEICFQAYVQKWSGEFYLIQPMLAEGEHEASIYTEYGVNNLISSINILPDAIKIKSSHIDLTGLVTITDLQGSGKTVINADNLTTGTIKGLNIEAAHHLHFGSDDAYINFDWYTGGYTGVLISGNKDITFESNSLGFSSQTALFVDGYRALDEDITVKNWDGNLLKMRFKKGIAWFFSNAAWSSGGGYSGNYNGMYIKNGIIQTINGSEGSH